MDGVAEVFTSPLSGNDVRIHLTGGHVGIFTEVDVEEALVVANVEVCFGAIVGDKHFTVLEGIHCSRVNIQIRVKLLHDHAQAPTGEKVSERCCGQTLAERGDNTTGHKDVFGYRNV